MNTNQFYVHAHIGVSQNEGYCLEVPIIRVIVFGGLYWVPLISGNCYMYMHIYVSREAQGMSSKARF